MCVYVCVVRGLGIGWLGWEGVCLGLLSGAKVGVAGGHGGWLGRVLCGLELFKNNNRFSNNL